MSKEIIQVIDQISREKGVSRDVLLGAIESALLSAARKRYGGRENIHIRLDEETFGMHLYETKTVTDEVEDPDTEVSVQDAAKLDPQAGVGDTVEVPLDVKDFGRIAAQTAKQVIFQRVREAERAVIFDEFKDKVGQVITGTVMRREKGAYYINVGKTDAVLPFRETLPGESPKRGDIMKAYIEEIRDTSKGPLIVVSRTDPRFVAELFKMEVPEINEGLVAIKDVVREPGERTKIVVYSTSRSIDPVGACVGMKGTRVQAIVRELRGERIDIIPWTDDLRMFIARALSPATIERVGIVEEEKQAMVVVSDQQLSIAIGKKGQNVRLAMKLTGWDIDIMSESEYSKIKMEEADRAFEGGGAEGAGEQEEAAADEEEAASETGPEEAPEQEEPASETGPEEAPEQEEQQ
ncbi:MAG: transcription termination factor NusA [Nitrospirota bacterium]|jgi:N utilization substance protein A